MNSGRWEQKRRPRADNRSSVARPRPNAPDAHTILHGSTSYGGDPRLSRCSANALSTSAFSLPFAPFSLFSQLLLFIIIIIFVVITNIRFLVSYLLIIIIITMIIEHYHYSMIIIITTASDIFINIIIMHIVLASLQALSMASFPSLQFCSIYLFVSFLLNEVSKHAYFFTCAFFLQLFPLSSFPGTTNRTFG